MAGAPTVGEAMDREVPQHDRRRLAQRSVTKRTNSADGVIPSRVNTIYGDGGTVGEAISPTARGYVVSTAARRDLCG
jgi:hypothetical protein